MARPDQVGHGYLLHKIVRVYPERVDPDLYREHYEHFNDKVCFLTDAEIRQEYRDWLESAGFLSGDLCKIVMVSRFGDCGITKDLTAAHGYTTRIWPECVEIYYPEHEKLTKVKDKSQAIGDFLEWLAAQGIRLAQYDPYDGEDNELYPVRTDWNELLAKHFEIDLKKLNDEKEQMIKVIRSRNG